MLTVCPKCALTLAVTAADLRLGQGYVRCGRCSDVFNALLSLREESVADTSRTQPQPVLQLEDVPEDGRAPDDRRAKARLPEEPAVQAAASQEPPPEPETPVETVATEADAPGEPIAEVEEFEVVFDDVPKLGAESTADDNPPAEGASVAHVSQPAADTDQPAAEVDEAEDAEAAPTQITAVQIEPPVPAVNRRLHHAQAAGVVLAALLLAGQCIHHWRNSIASNARWHPVMERIYAAFGASLTPDWKLDGYDIRQMGVASYGGDQVLWIKLQLANSQARAIPWPQVRVSLSDRYGKHLASRVLQPADYLTRAHQAGRFMQPAQRIETEVGVDSPVAATSSFELDVCLPAAGGLRCANDEVLGPPARS
jgi:predicted Zn finger-like uncharacterized protein